MKSNIIKYIFIIFVITIMGFVIYQSTSEKQSKEPQQKISNKEEDIIKEITLGIAEFDTIIEDWAKTGETTYLIKLRNDIKWSDGQVFTAEDVIFTIDTLKNVESIYSNNVKNIVKTTKIDFNTIQITTDQEIPFFEYNLIFPIMSKKFYEGENFLKTVKNNQPLGTGKYKITQNNAGTIILSKNENYKREELTLEKITINKYPNLSELYNAFKTRKIDLMTTTNIGIEKYIGTIGYNKVELSGREHDFLAINTQSDILSNKEVRQSIAKAINKENIVRQIYNNKYKVTNYFLDYGNWLKGETGETSYNQELSKQILLENGWEYKYNKWQKKINYSTKRINLKLVVPESNQERILVAEMIKANLEEIGIKITIIKANNDQYQNYLKNKNYDMILTGTVIGTSPNLETFFGIDNLANFSNEELSKIINEVKNITKEEILKRIREIYNEEVPYIGLYNNYYAIMSNWTLKGNISPNWYNIFLNINNWYKS